MAHRTHLESSEGAAHWVFPSRFFFFFSLDEWDGAKQQYIFFCPVHGHTGLQRWRLYLRLRDTANECHSCSLRNVHTDGKRLDHGSLGFLVMQLEGLDSRYQLLDCR